MLHKTLWFLIQVLTGNLAKEPQDNSTTNSTMVGASLTTEVMSEMISLKTRRARLSLERLSSNKRSRSIRPRNGWLNTSFKTVSSTSSKTLKIARSSKCNQRRLSLQPLQTASTLSTKWISGAPPPIPVSPISELTTRISRIVFNRASGEND